MNNNNNNQLQDIAFSFSIGNLSFLPMWIEFYYRNEEAAYYRHFIFKASDYLAALIVVISFSLLVYLGLRILKKSSFKGKILLADFALIAVYILIANVFRYELLLPANIHFYINFFKNAHVIYYLIPLALIIILFYSLKYWTFTRHALRIGILILTPFAILLSTRAIWNVITAENEIYVDEINTNAVSRDVSNINKVYWIIFDELDENLLFRNRPDFIKLPSFDRFRKESMYATNAHAPARTTLKAIPALTTGHLVSKANILKERDLELTIGDNEKIIRWSSDENIFHKISNSGLNVGIVGWYHPYCYIFNDSYKSCTSVPYYGTKVRRSNDENIVNILQNVLPLNIYFAPVRVIRERSIHLSSHLELLNAAKLSIGDKQLDFLYIHLPAPHLPDVYDHVNDKYIKFSLSRYSEAGYFGNLELADNALMQLREKLEEEDLWNNSTIIVTSDHVWRAFGVQSNLKEEQHVPFLVKLPDQQNGVKFEVPFNTIITVKLIRAILDGKISELDDFTNLIVENKTIERSPFQELDK